MERIQDLLHPVVAGLVRRAPYSEAKLVCAWRLAVGADIARVTRPQLTAGTVPVHLDDRRWLPELERSRALITERLQLMFGVEAVTGVEFLAPPTARGRRPRSGRAAR